jgi:phage gpG-like protein
MPHYKEVIAKLKKLAAEIPEIAGNEMVNHALDNIRAQGFEGTKWPPRKAGAPRNEGRALLIDTGDGMRSIRVTRKTGEYVEVDANDYMEAHNTGATISGTFGVRSHQRTRAGRTSTVRSHSRKVNTKLPERTFLAPSDALSARIVAAIAKRFNTIF